MPYSQNSELPKQVRDALPDEAQTRFRTVVNSALERGLSDSKAFASAWKVVGNGWEKPEGDGKWVRKFEQQPLYVHRKLENAADVIAWAKSQGFKTTMPPEALHATILYSKMPMDWPAPVDNQVTVNRRTGRSVTKLGDGGATVLKFEDPTLTSRWKELLDHGGSSDYPEFTPHVTISWDADGVDLSKVDPYKGPLVFGPEVFGPIDDSWKDNLTEKAGARHSRADMAMLQAIHDHAVELGASCNEEMDEGDDTGEDEGLEKRFEGTVLKVDAPLGIVFGWAIICKNGDQDYYDLQGDHIPEDAMLKSATDYMIQHRATKDMHRGEITKGMVVFAFPMTTEIAKAMGIWTPSTGLMVGYMPNNPEILSKYMDGTYTGFSIGGRRIKDEEAV